VADADPNRPLAMPWGTYRSIAESAWADALEQTHERFLQQCLERHPCLLPVVLPDDPPGGHHGAWLDVVVTQPPLSGYTARVPDFMWIERTSSDFTAVCLEVERPTKKWFNLDRTPTAHLTQALDQIQDWRSWFSNRPNDDFFDAFRIPWVWRRTRNFNVRFILAYGRRSEFDSQVGSRHGAGADALNRKRSEMMRSDTTQMTLDALVPTRSNDDLITIALRGGQLVATNIPPTFTTGPHVQDLARTVEGIEDAINCMDNPPSQERLLYLVKRIEYWRGVSGDAPYSFGHE
jgi:Domain of unknown function (DUF4263)